MNSQHNSSYNSQDVEDFQEATNSRMGTDITPIITSGHVSTMNEAEAAADKSKRLRELMISQREANIITALRLIRQVSHPATHSFSKYDSEKKIKKKTKKNNKKAASMPRDRQLRSEGCLLYTKWILICS